MSHLDKTLLSIIKWFTVIMIVVTVVLILSKFLAVMAYHKESALYDVLIDIFALLIQIILYRTTTQKNAYNRLLKYIWPMIVILGLVGSIYFMNEIIDINHYHYKALLPLMFYPLIYSIFIIVYGLFIGLTMKIKSKYLQIADAKPKPGS